MQMSQNIVQRVVWLLLSLVYSLLVNYDYNNSLIHLSQGDRVVIVNQWTSFLLSKMGTGQGGKTAN